MQTRRMLKPAYEQVEDEEDEHLYHTTGWTRELWIQALGMPAVLPPPEEVKKVETAIEAAQAKKSRAPKAKAKKAGAKVALTDHSLNRNETGKVGLC